MSYENPVIIIEENLSGLELEISKMQAIISFLPWLEKSFGRAKLMLEIKDKVEKTIPKVHVGKGEHYPVLPNDNLKSYSFFQVLGSELSEDYDLNQIGNSFECEIGIIFYMNLEKVGLNASQVKNDILKTLKNCTSFIFKEINDENLKDIFQGYRVKELPKKFNYYPYAGFRFSGTLYYNESC